MQPVWDMIDNLGDVSPFEHGAVFVFVDRLGNYEAEMSVITWLDDSPKGYECRIILDRLTPESVDNEWFSDDLPSIASFSDIDLQLLKDSLCSPNVLDRALAYLNIYYYNGMGQELEEITQEEAIHLYGNQYENMLT